MVNWQTIQLNSAYRKSGMCPSEFFEYVLSTRGHKIVESDASTLYFAVGNVRIDHLVTKFKYSADFDCWEVFH